MPIPPNEHVLLLVERWPRLQPIAVPSVIILRSAASTVLNLKRPGLKTWPRTSARSYPACLFPRPAPRSSSACLQSASGMTF